MRRTGIVLGLAVMLTALFIQGCGDPVSRSVASRGRFRVIQWLRYEFQSVKTFSYGSSQVKENMHVIGYEPSWLVYDSLYLNYPYQLMSDLVIGEYDLNPMNGYARNDSARDAFRNKDIVPLAAAVNGNINTLLAVTDYGDFRRSPFRREFLPENAKKNLLNTLDLLLDEMNQMRDGGQERPNVGILLDFPSVPWKWRKDYVEFVARMRRFLSNPELGKRCLIYAVIPPENETSIYKDTNFVKALNQNVDVFIMRGHTFRDTGKAGGRGPMLPFRQSGEVTVDSMVNFYTNTAKIPRKKLVLEFPYYGKHWVNDTLVNPMRPLVPLNEVMNTVDAPPEFDLKALAWKRKVDTTAYYYEDSLTLAAKYDWVLENQLGGVSLYGLGYAHGMDKPEVETALWRVLAEHFAEPSPRLLFPGVGFLLCFIGIGIVASVVRHWQVRYALRAKMRVFWYYFALLSLLILAIVLCVLPIETVPIIWKLISLAILLFFPLGRKALKFLFKAAR